MNCPKPFGVSSSPFYKRLHQLWFLLSLRSARWLLQKEGQKAPDL